MMEVMEVTTTSLNQYQTVTTMKDRTQAVPIHAGTMIIAPATENAPLGAGAMEKLTATARRCLTCARLMNRKTVGAPTAAGTPWSATEIENARPGAIVTESPTAEALVS